MAGLLTMKESDNVEIAGVCDIYQKRLDAFAQKTGGKPFVRYKELLSSERVGLCAHCHARALASSNDTGRTRRRQACLC